MLRVSSLVPLVVLGLALAAPAARAVCVGVDTDVDGVCDVDDNCPVTPNAGQLDNDEDLAGDPCDSVDGAFLETKASIRRAANSLRGQGKGFLRVSPPASAFDVPSGVSATVRDGGTTVLAVTWAAAECVSIRGASRCITTDRTSRLVVKPVRNVPGVFRARVRIRQFQVATAFPPPATFTLTRGDVTWESQATACSVQANGITCKTPH